MPSLFKNFRRRISQTDDQQQPTSSSTLVHSPSMVSNTSRTSKIFSPSTSSHRHQYSIRVALLDGRVIQLNYTKNDDASHLFNRVCDEEQIGGEKDWFGLRFVDSHGQPHWLDMHKNARSQLKKGLPSSMHLKNFLHKSENSDGQLKVSPSKSSMNSSSYSFASATLPRQSSSRLTGSTDFHDQRDTESHANISLNDHQPNSFSSSTLMADTNVSELQFRFKFYPQQPTNALQEEATRYALVKQLRSDFRSGKLTGSVSDESKLIACLLQADLGNLAEHDERGRSVSRSGEPQNSNFRATPPMPSMRRGSNEAGDNWGVQWSQGVPVLHGVNISSLPKDELAGGPSPPTMDYAISIPEVYREMNHFGNTGEEKIFAEWKALADATPAVCDETLLNVASQLESYGIADMTPIHDQQTDRDGAMLGCNYAGILVRNATRRIVNAFAWQKVQKVNLDGKLILVYVLDSESSSSSLNAAKSSKSASGAASTANGSVGPKSPVGSDETSKFVYKCRSGSGAKALWKFILENKIFYLAASSKGIAPVRSGRIGPLSFHRRVTLRFSGRTSREAIEHGESIKRQRQQVAAASGGSEFSPLQPQPVQRIPLVAAVVPYAASSLLLAADNNTPSTPILSDQHNAVTTSGVRHGTGAGDENLQVEDASNQNWSQNTKHDLINKLHDRQLQHSLEVMQRQTHHIADEFQDIRSPNTVGMEASRRPRFDEFLPTPAAEMVDGVQGFFQQPAAPYSEDSRADEYRFCTVGDDSMMHSQHHDMLPQRRNDDVLVMRNGQWVAPMIADHHRHEQQQQHDDFSLRERITSRRGNNVEPNGRIRNRDAGLNRGGSKKLRWILVASTASSVLLCVFLWLMLSNGDDDDAHHHVSSGRKVVEHESHVESNAVLKPFVDSIEFLYDRMHNALDNVGRYFSE